MKITLSFAAALWCFGAYAQAFNGKPHAGSRLNADAYDWAGAYHPNPGSRPVQFNQENDPRTNSRLKEIEDVTWNRIVKLIPASERFMYEDFTPGTVVFFNKTVDSLKLNFDRYLSVMEGIGENGDTLLLKPFEGLKYVVIGKDLYHHHMKYGFGKFITDPNDSVKLLSRQYTHVLASEVVRTSGNRTLPKNRYEVQIPVPNEPFKVHRAVFEKRQAVYLMDGKGKVYPSNRETWFALYKPYRAIIEGYLDQLFAQQTPPDFNDEIDMMALLKFCQRVEEVYNK